MRDSVRLVTRIYQPSDPASHPTLLIRTAEDPQSYQSAARVFVRHGYNVAIQSLRGRFGSEGADSLFFHQRPALEFDGYDTVEWLAKQPWSTGKIGMFGEGEAGFVQYFTAAAGPPHLRAQYIVSAPFSLYQDAAFQNGAFREELMQHWLPHLSATDLTPVLIQHPRYDAFWLRLDAARLVPKFSTPITQVTGWFDVFLQGAISAFQHVQKKGQKIARQYQRLVIGPWATGMKYIGRQEQGELIYPENATFNLLEDAVRWFDQWLKSEDTGILIEPPVKYYLMGDIEDTLATGNVWRSAGTWPPKFRPVKYFLQKNGLLGTPGPDKRGTAEGFRYQPADPVPTVGGANFSIEAGPHDQQTVELRQDVLIFTSPPLEQELAIAGPVMLKLYAASSAYDTDFTAKLTDVYPDGRSMLVTDGIIRARFRQSLKKEKLLRPDKVYPFWVPLGHTAMVFNKGHRIRLAISSSNHPRFQANPNSPLPFSRQKQNRTAVNTIYYSGQKASYLRLPVISVE